jgi:molybdopterin molybdotransferase
VAGAVGLISVRTVRTAHPEPPRDAAAMDGFAVRFVGGRPRRSYRLLQGLVTAGKSAQSLLPGEAIAISTGAPLPGGADAVARKERTLRVGHTLRVRGRLRIRTDVHRKGEDLPEGATIVRQGERVRPYHVALLLAQGIRTIRARAARLTLIPIGDELTGRPGRSRGAIRDSISPLIGALAPSSVCSATPPVPDRRAALTHALRRAAGASDLVVTIGGASVGVKDLTKPAVASIGTVLFGGVRVNVLKRSSVGVVGRVPVVMLPGQVVSAVVAWHEHGLHVLSRLLRTSLVRWERVRLEESLRNPHPMDSVYLFGVRDGLARPRRWGVRLYSDLLRSNAWGIIPRHCTLRAGTTLRVQRLIEGG